MSKRLSELYGMDIYTTKGQFVGRVQDVILNLEKGEIMRLSLQSFKGSSPSGEEVRRILRDESIPYEEVAEVGDIILVHKIPSPSRGRKEIAE
ncbi:MAG: PRC-barrel domain-containing protein [Candidatus Altiarchaeota archaeon]